jgi:hypothetical protein
MTKRIFVLCALLALAACKEKAEYSIIGGQGTLKAVSVPASRAGDMDHYKQIIDAECPRRGICILSFFVGLSSVNYPLSDAALEAQTAQYNRNTNTGMDRLLLACRLPEASAGECL